MFARVLEFGELVTGQLDTVDPQKMADGLSKDPLAYGAVILLLLLVASNTFMIRALMKSYEDRVALMERMYDLLLTTHRGTVTLGLKFTEGLGIVEKVIEQKYNRQRED